MADDKIVTKKTAAKPAATAKKAPAKAATPARAVTKKAAPKPAAPPIVESRPARPAATPPAPAAAVPHKTPSPKPKSAEPPLAHPLDEKPVTLHGLADVAPEQRIAMIREAAYYKAEKRGFAAGNDAQDWAEAEREIDELLAKARQILGG